MNVRSLRIIAGTGLTALLFSIGCGGGSSSSSLTATPATTGNVHVILSDDPTEDWATIGVKVLSVSLVPQGGGSPVVVYTAPSTPPMINLVQLDQLGEIIGNTSIQPGTYTSANISISTANTGTACDVLLVASADPSSGFDQPAGSTVPCSNLQIVGGSSGSITIPITLASPLTVTTSATSALDLEFDLKHPALIVEHYPVGASAPTWAVNFKAGAIRHHKRPDLTAFLLRHMYGQVASISTDNTTMTINRAFAVYPVTSSETATVSTISLPILADSTNGTLYYNLDSTTPGANPTTIYNFSTLTSLPGENEYVRVAARYQANGTLVATRIFAGSAFNTVWKNPEGHVLHVNPSPNVNTMRISTEDGKSVALQIGSETKFFFRSSNTDISNGNPIQFFEGSSQGLPNLARGFKVNATIDPASSTTPPTALTVDIDVARYDGAITSPTATGFNYTRTFANADSLNVNDNYAGTLDYISPSSSNVDQQGNAVSGFYWWDFTYPTLATTGTGAVSAFESAVGGSVNFGWETLKVKGLSSATWNDPAAVNAWAADWTVLMPAAAPLGAVVTPYNNGSFTFQAPAPTGVSGTPQPVTVDVSTTSGSATLVYQVDRTGGVITVTQQDGTNAATYANLAAGTKVKVFGVPNTNGSIQAYVLFYYTNTVPQD